MLVQTDAYGQTFHQTDDLQLEMEEGKAGNRQRGGGGEARGRCGCGSRSGGRWRGWRNVRTIWWRPSIRCGGWRRWWSILDVSGFCAPIKAREGVAGRDATDPQLLVALWLYACVRGIGSARELARQCEENAAFRWLCGGVTVNHRLLSDFRTDHGEALDQLFTQVIASLVDKDVVKVSRISQDGVRVRVGAGASSFRREERLEKLLEEAQRHVEELRQQLGLAGRASGG